MLHWSTWNSYCECSTVWIPIQQYTLLTLSNELHSYLHTHSCTHREESGQLFSCFQIGIHTTFSRIHAGWTNSRSQADTHRHRHTLFSQSTLSLQSFILLFLIMKVFVVVLHLQKTERASCKRKKKSTRTHPPPSNYTWKGNRTNPACLCPLHVHHKLLSEAWLSLPILSNFPQGSSMLWT